MDLLDNGIVRSFGQILLVLSGLVVALSVLKLGIRGTYLGRLEGSAVLACSCSLFLMANRRPFRTDPRKKGHRIPVQHSIPPYVCGISRDNGGTGYAQCERLHAYGGICADHMLLGRC